MYKRNRAPRISLGSLLVTFLLGAVVGAGTMYGFLASAPPETAPLLPPVDIAAPVQDARPEPPPVADEPPTAALPAAALPAEVDDPDEVEAAVPEGPLRGARFLFVSTRGTVLSQASRQFLEEFQPGGVVLLGHNIESRAQTIAYVEAIKEAAGMGAARGDLPLIAVDQEGGTVNRLRLRQAPSASEIGARGDAAYAAEAATNFAEACRARGIAVNFAPVLDIYDPAGPRDFAQRAFSDDGGLVTVLGLAFAGGLMDGGVLPVAKHYPGHGAATRDTHDGPAALDHPVDQLAHIMYPFAEAVARGLPGIMTGHITVTQLDADAPATLSSRLLRQVLRERWGYDGVIISDDLAMRAITDHHTLEEAAVRALQAGCDALIITETNEDTLRRVALAIERAIEQGILDDERMRHSQRRLDEWQAWVRAADAAEADDDVTRPVDAVDEFVALEEIEDALEDAAPAEAVEPVDADEPDDAPELEPEEIAAEDAAVEAEEADAPAPVMDDEDDAPEEAGEPEAADEPAVTAPAPSSVEGLVPVYHQVRQGEWLSRIALLYGVTTRQLVEWNNLPNDNVRYGTRLTVYLPPEQAAEITGEPVAPPGPAPVEDDEATGEEAGEDDAEADDGADAQVGAEEAADPAPAASDLPDPAAQPPGTRALVHEVMPGETLTRLALRYRVGTSNIIAWNDLDTTIIRVGQRLTIFVPENANINAQE